MRRTARTIPVVTGDLTDHGTAAEGSRTDPMVDASAAPTFAVHVFDDTGWVRTVFHHRRGQPEADQTLFVERPVTGSPRSMACRWRS
jgi:hypothetical protein